MPRACRDSAGSIVAWLLCTCVAGAGIEPTRLYTPRGQPLSAKVCGPSGSAEPIDLWLIDPASGATIARSPVAEGLVDLGALFPAIWAAGAANVLSVQAVSGGVPDGAPLIVEPLTPTRRAADGLSAVVMEAIESGDRASLLKLLSEPESSRRAARQAVMLAPETAGTERPMAARTYLGQRVVLETSAGELEIALHPEAAPRTCFHFLQLVRGGFYDGTTFHRIVAADGRGRPFLVQGGDPIGTGAGGPGFAIDFEPSTLPHDFGVVSMARQPNDPNSAGSQFFICLSRDACAALDGRYTSFARLVRGVDVLSAVAITPVRPARNEPGGAAGDRPIDPPVIRCARAIDAPPISIGEQPPPPTPGDPAPAPAPADR